jgi:hypothetical protein
MPDRWDTTSCRAGGGPPVGFHWALSGGHSVPDRWKSADSTGRGEGPPTGFRWEPLGGRSVLGRNDVVSGPSQLSGPDGQAGRRRPAGQSAGRVPVGPGRRATRHLRQARGTDSKGTGEPGRPVCRCSEPSPAPGGPDGRRWLPPPLGWRRSRRLDGPSPLRTTPHAPNRFHLIRALTGFPAHQAGGPSDPCNPCSICTLLHLNPGFSSRGTVDFCLCCNL